MDTPFEDKATRKVPKEGMNPDGRELRRFERDGTDRIYQALQDYYLITWRNGPMLAETMAQSEIATRPLQAALVDFLGEVATAGVGFGQVQVEKVMGVKQNGAEVAIADWTLANAEVVKWAWEYGGELIKGITETTLKGIRAEISRFAASGETMPDLITRIQDTYMYSRARAENIAVTEVTRAYAEGNRQAWKESGVVEGRRWNTANDEIVCPICRPLNGLVTTLDKPWSHPRYGRIEMPGHPRCRCWSTPVVDVEAEESVPVQPLILNQQNIKEQYQQIKEAFIKSLTPEEKDLFENWGRSGAGIRKLQALPSAELTAQQKELLRKWDVTLNKAPMYQGQIMRGLTEVPKDVIDSWINSTEITLSNDQSATTMKKIAAEFMPGNEGRVLWDIDQQTGRHLMEQTRVTVGGDSQKIVTESEVVIRQGTRYRITNIEYRYDDDAVEEAIQSFGKPVYVTGPNNTFDSASYFEGHPFSWPENPPPDWDLGRDTFTTRGYYYFKLEEIE